MLLNKELEELVVCIKESSALRYQARILNYFFLACLAAIVLSNEDTDRHTQLMFNIFRRLQRDNMSSLQETVHHARNTISKRGIKPRFTGYLLKTSQYFVLWQELM